MRESRQSGSVRGAAGNSRPYRDSLLTRSPLPDVEQARRLRVRLMTLWVKSAVEGLKNACPVPTGKPTFRLDQIREPLVCVEAPKTTKREPKQEAHLHNEPVVRPRLRTASGAPREPYANRVMRGQARCAEGNGCCKLLEIMGKRGRVRSHEGPGSATSKRDVEGSSPAGVASIRGVADFCVRLSRCLCLACWNLPVLRSGLQRTFICQAAS